MKHFQTELIAGITTFLTMSYIVVVNPAILATEGTGLSFDGVLTATILVSFLSTLLMGLYAKLPLALAPGMGINAFFAFTLVLSKGIEWTLALGMVFWSGVLFVILSLTGVREKIVWAIPHSLRVSVAAGIGLFLSFIGLQSSGIVEKDPVTFIRFATMDFQSLAAVLGIAVMMLLFRFAKPFAFVGGILVVCVLAFLYGDVELPNQWITKPDFESVFFKLDLWGSLQLALLPAVFALAYTDILESLSTFVGLGVSHQLVDETGQPKNLRKGLLVDALSTLMAGLFGSSSGTVYIESASGIEAGGKTGKTAVIAALCFLPFLFLSPLLSMIPLYATGPVLFLVGSSMFRSVLEINFSKIEESFPAYVTVALIPLTFSITQGILWGILSHCFLYIINGRKKELSPSLLIIAAFSIVLLVIEYTYT